MLLGHAGDMELHGCSTCGGIWLGTACAQKFAEGLPNRAIALAIHHAVNAKDAVETAALIACPVWGCCWRGCAAEAIEALTGVEIGAGIPSLVSYMRCDVVPPLHSIGTTWSHRWTHLARRGPTVGLNRHDAVPPLRSLGTT